MCGIGNPLNGLITLFDTLGVPSEYKSLQKGRTRCCAVENFRQGGQFVGVRGRICHWRRLRLEESAAAMARRSAASQRFRGKSGCSLGDTVGIRHNAAT